MLVKIYEITLIYTYIYNIELNSYSHLVNRDLKL